MVTARLDGRRWWLEPGAADPAATLLHRLADSAGGRVVLGFDLPLGLPARYAAARGIAAFPSFLAGLEPDDPFLVPASAESLSLRQPFYPARPGGASRAFQAARLGVDHHRQLWRRCDLPTALRPGACPMFWTLGPQQCGKAALACWRDVVRPALALPSPPALWPFDGELPVLAASRWMTLVETYPAECYGQLGLPRFAKSSQAARARQAPRLLAVTDEAAAAFEPELRQAVEAGFPLGAGDEHLFDALIGCLALLQVLQGRRSDGLPTDAATRQVEGWMLGLDAALLR